MDDAESFWEPQESPGDEYNPYFPPIPADRIREWEERNGLQLPVSLAEALTVHDGGWVRGSVGTWIDRLENFSLCSDPGWDQHFAPGNQEEEEFEGVDRSKLVMFGDACGCGLILDYRRGGEPGVLVMWHNLGGILRDEGCRTFDEFIARSLG
mgnify:CR=1 FL=1